MINEVSWKRRLFDDAPDGADDTDADLTGGKPRALFFHLSLFTPCRMPELDLTGINVINGGTVLVVRNAVDTRSINSICSYCVGSTSSTSA